MKIRRKPIFLTLLILLIIGIASATFLISVNSYTLKVGKAGIVTEDKAAGLEDADCIVVLGCGVYENGSPSPMLADRLQVGIKLYEKGAAPKIIMSGDHGREDYDEVNVMKQYAVDRGVPSEDIFMDHAGFSTYESIYRAKEIFRAKKIIIVSQEYHLSRALTIAKELGLEAVGVSADLREYSGQQKREVREVIARSKDFIFAKVKAKPTYLGETIPVSGNGNVTNDK